MADRFVLDSSALAKTFLTEPESSALRAWLKERIAKGDSVVAPTLVAYELGELIRQRRLGSPTTRLRILETVLTLVRLVSHESLIAGASERGALLTFYDATFVSLAEAIDATLVTYDRGMANHGQALGRPTLSPGLT